MTLILNYPYKNSEVRVTFSSEEQKPKYVAIVDNIFAFYDDDLEVAKQKAFNWVEKRALLRQIKSTQLSSP